MLYFFSYIVVAEDKPIEKVQYADFRDTKYPKDLKELLYNYCIRLYFKIPFWISAKFHSFSEESKSKRKRMQKSEKQYSWLISRNSKGSSNK